MIRQAGGAKSLQRVSTAPVSVPVTGRFLLTKAAERGYL